MSTFKEFPKKMSHPEYRAAVFEQLPCHCTDKSKCNCRVGLFARDTIMKSPERYAEVTVQTSEQQQFYESRGYRSNSAADRAAYEQALLEQGPVAGYKNNAYPKWKYSKFEVPLIVNGKNEEDALLGEWFDSPVEATEDDLEDVVDEVSVSTTPEVHEVKVSTPKAKKPAAKKTAKKTTKAGVRKVSRAPKTATE